MVFFQTLAPDTQPGWLSVPWLSALHVFVHPRTVDIDCAGDRLRHISTQLGTAAEKHINWLHWEPCLVTMAKHTGRGEGGRRRRVETGQRVQSTVSQGLSFSNAPSLSSGHVCHFLSASLLLLN